MITSRRIGGRRAQRSGSNFQNVITLSASRAESGVKLYELPSCGGRFVGKGIFVRQEMPCDFVGVFIAQRLPLFFDAKSCGDDSTGLRVHDHEIMKRHQVVFLQAMAQAGAVAGVLVESRKRGEYLWLDAKHLRDGKAIPWHDTRWVSLGPTTSLVDFKALVSWLLK